MTNTPSKLGWIGIGRMGYAMAERLAKGGADLTVWNRTRAKAEPLTASGAKVAAVRGLHSAVLVLRARALIVITPSRTTCRVRTCPRWARDAQAATPLA